MKNITKAFQELYVPYKAIVIFQALNENERNAYVEVYDLDEHGFPFNARPLNVEECTILAEVVNSMQDFKTRFLRANGLIPRNILYINPERQGFAVWYSPPGQANVFFEASLGIPSGIAHVPALVWKASKDALYVYALKDWQKITEDTQLFYAPFYNIYKDGIVCMGTVNTELDPDCALEEFIVQWEQFFWNSYFSHPIDNYNPVKADMKQLWTSQVESSQEFPTSLLVKNGMKIKTILQ